MFDRSKFLDIEPYNREESEAACQRLKQNPQFIYALANAMYPGLDEATYAKRVAFVKGVLSRLDDVHGYDDFQKSITCGVFLESIISDTIDGFTFSGLENLDAGKSYLFISNHRDIVLDCALLDLALYRSGKGLCEMAIGDNLLANKAVEDIFKLNGAIIVKRDLPVREKYLETIRLSEYFVEKIASGKSIWVAQKSGRSKDGLDLTHPSIIKMLFLSNRRKGISFADTIRSCHIVPVAVSYEYDPNDIAKAREEVITIENGEYNKSSHEDVFSMIRGLRGYKGRVHISVGSELTGEYADPESVAAELDRQIHSDYMLWPTNWFSYDMLCGNEENSDKYEGFDKAAFLSRFAHLNESVRDFILNSYANPVRSALNAAK